MHYADDKTPCACSENNNVTLENLEEVRKTVFEWFSNNFLIANADKCHVILCTIDPFSINSLKAIGNLSFIGKIFSSASVVNNAFTEAFLYCELLLLVFDGLVHIFGVSQISIDRCFQCHTSEMMFFRTFLMFAPLSNPACHFKEHKSNF